MVAIHLAHTEPINPLGAQPVLTHSQAWAGLVRKARSPQDFIPIVDSCEIHSETEDGVDCTITFKSGVAHAPKLRELCTLRPPCGLDYEMYGGSKSLQIISSGPTGNGELFLTFVFAWEHHDLVAGSAEAREIEHGHREVSGRRGACPVGLCVGGSALDRCHCCQGHHCEDENAGGAREGVKLDQWVLLGY